MPDTARIQKAIQKEKLSGWLFFNFSHRDKISDRILDIAPEAMNTRPWYYIVPAKGTPEKIVNTMERKSLEHLPGNENIYSTQKELFSLLKKFRQKKAAAQYSENINVISYLDYGTVLNLKKAGWKIVPSERLIQRYMGLVNEKQIELHNKAAEHLYEIIDIIWNRIRENINKNIYEGDVRNWILDEFRKRGMITDHDPIVASGANSANPHYCADAAGKKINDNEIIQLDIWAKLDLPDAVFADISWIGFTGSSVPGYLTKVFEDLCYCRDKCFEYINKSIAENKVIRGLDADAICRDLLIARGYGKNIRHRTGHGIDTDNHGSGANLDSVEFPDKRELLNGSCFSIEPGIYSDEYGMRTEINVYIQNSKAIISGGSIQNDILKFS